MDIQALVALVHTPYQAGTWSGQAKAALEALWASDGRYPKDAAKTVTVRAPEMRDDGVAFASLIHPSNPSSGPFGGTSLTVFPVPDRPALVTLVVGTLGLSPDEEILGRPGHARKAAAICRWLNRQDHGAGLRAWAKSDPTRTDQDVPANVRRLFPEYRSAFDRYGKVIYALYAPDDDEVSTGEATAALLDLMFEDRGIEPRAAHRSHREQLRSAWLAQLLPELERTDVEQLLRERRYVILEGPPGTGKTHLSRRILTETYHGRGEVIQFHANTTHEEFIGGLAPVPSNGAMGFAFEPRAGSLITAAAAAAADPEADHLLVIDEVNRADVAKVLGEALYLLEADDPTPRELTLPLVYAELGGRSFTVPPNLCILGTMNSADRSTAIVDIAVRRRFAFAKLWPQLGLVQALSCRLMQEAFSALVELFVEHAPEEAFDLIPGHAYFLEPDAERAVRRLQATVAPLMQEYLAQGYVAGMAGEVRAYLDWLGSLTCDG